MEQPAEHSSEAAESNSARVGVGSDALFSVGEIVSMEEWDATVPPAQRIGKAKVDFIVKSRCESGWMYGVNNGEGLMGRFDQGWLTRITPDLLSENSPDLPTAGSAASTGSARPPTTPLPKPRP